MRAAGVVVVGGGIMGLATAYYLAQQGVTDVVVIERGRIGEGSTPRAAGMIRQQFAHPIGVRLARRSLEIYRDFTAITGVDPGLHEPGYLVLATTEQEADAAQQAVAVQRAAGLDARYLDRSEIARYYPELQTEGLAGAGYCATDGYVDPARVLQGYATAARAAGLTIEEATDVQAITMAGGRVGGVETSRGAIATATVVNAAGCGAAVVAALAGDTLPVIGLEHQIVVLAQPAGLPRERPMVVDFRHGYYFYARGDGLLVGMGGSGDRPGVPPGFDEEAWAATQAELLRRLPTASTPVVRHWTGMIDYTPDNLPVLGWSPRVAGLFTAVSAGHGIMYGPGLALAAAELLTGRSDDPALQSLAPARFDGQGTRSSEAYSFSAPAAAFAGPQE